MMPPCPLEAGHDAIVAVGTGPRMRRYIINNSALVRLIRLIRGSIQARKTCGSRITRFRPRPYAAETAIR